MPKYFAALFFSVFGIAPQSWAGESLLHVDMPYVEARKTLRAHNWSPTDYAHRDMSVTDNAAEMDDTLRSPFVSRGAPEVGACFPTGLGQCFAIWTKGNRVLVLESRSEGFKPISGPTVFYYYEVAPSGIKKGLPLTRQDWDYRSANVVPNSYPKRTGR
jgi:hypothetical protein